MLDYLASRHLKHKLQQIPKNNCVAFKCLLARYFIKQQWKQVIKRLVNCYHLGALMETISRGWLMTAMA